MMKLERSRISVKKSDIHGWGVFSEQDIFPGDLIEACHYASVEKKYNPFRLYTFDVPSENAGSEVDPEISALVFGSGSIYNHSDLPNADWVFDLHNNIIVFSATRPIISGEEIFISYGPEWFQTRGIDPVKAPTFAHIPIRYRVKKFFRDYKNLLRMFLGAAAIMASIAGLQMIYRLAL